MRHLVDSMKALQAAVGNPTASGSTTTFVDSISQDAEGKITATRKSVNFAGYQTTAGMANYQALDLQQVGEVEVDGSGTEIATNVQHGMKHYPTVRLLDSEGKEVRPTAELTEPYTVTHVDEESLKIVLSGELNVSGAAYRYVLD